MASSWRSRYQSTACLYLGVDDDIAYPPRYVASLCNGIRAYGNRPVVGYHGVILARPVVQLAKGHTVLHFAEKLDARKVVDLLGTGTIMFSPQRLRFDFRSWPHVNAMDLYLALEAARAKHPLVCLERDRGFLRALAEDQRLLAPFDATIRWRLIWLDDCRPAEVF